MRIWRNGGRRRRKKLILRPLGTSRSKNGISQILPSSNAINSYLDRHTFLKVFPTKCRRYLATLLDRRSRLLFWMEFRPDFRKQSFSHLLNLATWIFQESCLLKATFPNAYNRWPRKIPIILIGSPIGRSDSQDDYLIRDSDMSRVNHVLHSLDYIP